MADQTQVQETQIEAIDAQQAAPQEASPSVTLEDLTNAARIIGAAMERGAFKAQEMSGVAKVYDKISEFLQYAAEQAKAAKGE